MRLDFWMTRSGAYVSHSEGLSIDTIRYLRQLQPGDRLIIYMNDKEEENSRVGDLTLKKYTYVQENTDD